MGNNGKGKLEGTYASMGPLTFVSGNTVIDISDPTNPTASMGPLTFVSGNTHIALELARGERASMGPLTFVSGNGEIGTGKVTNTFLLQWGH